MLLPVHAPFCGWLMTTDGGVVSEPPPPPPPFDTVTDTAGDVVVLPAASRATAVRTCEPLATVVVSQLIENGLPGSSAPRLTPFSLNCTPATPTLSPAVALTVTVPETVAPLVGALIAIVGAVVSAVPPPPPVPPPPVPPLAPEGVTGVVASLFTVTGAETVELPAVSVATAWIWYAPVGNPLVVHHVSAVHGLAVQVCVKNTPPLPHSLIVLSAAAPPVAVAATWMLLPIHAPVCGVVMVTLGAVPPPPPPPGGGVPFATVIVIAAVAVRPAPSVTARLSVWL